MDLDRLIKKGTKGRRLFEKFISQLLKKIEVRNTSIIKLTTP